MEASGVTRTGLELKSGHSRLFQQVRWQLQNLVRLTISRAPCHRPGGLPLLRNYPRPSVEPSVAAERCKLKNPLPNTTISQFCRPSTLAAAALASTSRPAAATTASASSAAEANAFTLAAAASVSTTGAGAAVSTSTPAAAAETSTSTVEVAASASGGSGGGFCLHVSGGAAASISTSAAATPNSKSATAVTTAYNVGGLHSARASAAIEASASALMSLAAQRPLL